MEGNARMDMINPIVRRWCEDGERDPEGFWARAAEKLPWFRHWDTVLEAHPPTFRWFVGAQTNLSYNCLDHHVSAGQGGRAALIALNEQGDCSTHTYAQLLETVKEIAAALRGLGVKRGDRVAIYMPTCPDAIALMLACTRIGAIHIVVFAGFAAGALAERIRLAGAKVVFCTDFTWRKGKEVPLKPIVDEAVKEPGVEIEHVVMLTRKPAGAQLTPNRDLLWPDFLALAKDQSSDHEVMESSDPAYILATSGTTARPKLTVHTHGDYQVGIYSMGQWLFGLKPTDIWWSTSDIGWVVGHSYIVYAPLVTGCTTIAFEGALDYPGPEAFWRHVARQHVTAMFTSPTAVRMLMRYGEEAAAGCDLSALDRVFCAGEPLNPPAWEWLQKRVFHDRIPVIDHMWQTETGGPIIGNPYGLGMLPIKPGSAGIPLPGISVSVLDTNGQPLPDGEQGLVVVNRPFPGLTATLWGETERYGRDYWDRIPGAQVYFTGDAGSFDKDGYVWFSGRADEIVNVAGHRLGMIEVETALLRNPAVAEAGATGRPDEVRGEVISVFVVLRAGYTPSEETKRDLLATVRHELGPVVVIGDVNFVHMLPKTRSGKIMRRVFKAVVLNRDPGDISTIEDEGSVDEAREAWEAMRTSVGTTEE